MNILGISGSLQEASLNTQLLKVSQTFMPDNISFNITSLKDIALYNEDLDNSENRPIAVEQLMEQISASDAIIFATPEYNHGVSGVLKNAIDWVSRPAFKSPLCHKPSAIITASKSPVGGARAQADLKNILSSTLSLIYPSVEMLVPIAHEKLNDSGELVDATTERHLSRYIQGFISWATKVESAIKT